MRLRLGLGIGFAVGYYLGARAGRERYEQINDAVRRIRRSDTFETAAGKAKEAVELGVERAKDVVDSRFGDGDEPPGFGPDPYLSPGSAPP